MMNLKLTADKQESKNLGFSRNRLQEVWRKDKITEVADLTNDWSSEV